MSFFRVIAIMLALGFVRLLRPIVRIRFGNLFVSRLGHLAGNTECYLCEKDEGVNRPKRVFDIWCPEGRPANEQLLKMFRRVIPVSRFAHAVNEVGKRWEWWRQDHTFADSQWGRDIHNLMEKHPPHLKFTKSEEERGRRGLKMFGIPEGAKWVCIINRDPMFLRMTEPWADYSYHDYRNSSIQNYREAAVALMDRGYFVLRMGHFVEERMALQSPKFIDYACHPLRCDFMDVYLGAKCAFTISNSCGFDGIPMIFRRPICFVNEAPLEYLSTWIPNSLAIWKHHQAGNNRLTTERMVECGASLFYKAQQFKDAGITLVENSAAEILDVALEMADHVEGKDPVRMDDAQHAFWSKFPRSNSPHNGQPLHGGIRLRIGTKFLSGYAD